MPEPDHLLPHNMSFFPALPVPLDLAVQTAAPGACPYLPGRVSVSRGFRCGDVPGWAYQSLLDTGFRRSGDVFYQMACRGCRACVAIRVPAGEFRPTKSQRRVLRRNRDLTLRVGTPTLTDEKHELYSSYLAARHDGTMSGAWEELEGFLYRSPTDTLEVCYRDSRGRLAGVGICDVTPKALSTVYFYFDPTMQRRGLGIFSSLVEIEMARSMGLAHYYLGFWIEGCPKMQYKEGFRPCELLCTDGRWRPLTAATAR